MEWIIGHILAVGIGLSLGLIGGGGSVLAAPVLIYVMDVPTRTALAMTLVIVGVASLIGVIPHWMQKNVNLKTAALFAPPAMLGAYLGARMATLPFVTSTIQLVAFAIMMLIASILMIRKDARSIQHQSKVTAHTKLRWLAIALEGLGVGIITGFVGIGGGFLVIPALVLLGKTPMKEAIGTSLVILALKSVTGFIGYLDQVTINWNLLFSFTVAASTGILVGAYLSRFVQAKNLEKGFGYFILAVAIFILVQR